MNLKQLSHMLSLSQTTVSRALNGYPEVSEDTRRRVIDAAKRHGYRPNPSARRLATGKAGMIGYVMPTGESVDIDPHFVEFLSGLGDYARAHELDLVLSPTLLDEEEMTYRRVVANKQVDAVYVSSPRPADRRIKLVEQLGIPYIVHGRSEGLDFDYPFLDIDNEGAFHDAARLLIQLGHRRIALMNDELTKTFAIHRERGVRRALAASALELFPELALTATMTEENGYRGARALLDLPDRPTAIICSSMIMALGIVRATRELNLEIPRDLSLVAHDDVFHYLKPESFPVPLTTTRSSIRAAGERIAERLAARMSGLETGARAEVWPVDLVVRGSIAGAPV
ncbi:LacI family DNA-binding transcriptional regulator [Mesorhizobium sp. BAC0120]|uniref:LacI family DNA-binding transcriptional regulator n=1 Tax=Mesorhizobium sp. BAC0120 TaxID=3090670 RepID=UPI00298CF887|nr:LacI family DNA-binding transcriptional regulator [Mesorhizobium sp. BAC0120]MDW6025702.1 LacI family DNA-binding transcriptional regulator [Mesorhizobium sp. BAC0120]